VCPQLQSLIDIPEGPDNLQLIFIYFCLTWPHTEQEFKFHFELKSSREHLSQRGKNINWIFSQTSSVLFALEERDPNRYKEKMGLQEIAKARRSFGGASTILFYLVFELIQC